MGLAAPAALRAVPGAAPAGAAAGKLAADIADDVPSAEIHDHGKDQYDNGMSEYR